MKSELQTNEILDGRFKVTKLISHGGLASVFEAVDRKTGKQVALKVPFSGYEANPVYYSRFLKEEAIGRSLNHPSVVRIFQADEKSRPYIVMERLEGRLLSEILHEGQPLALDEALRIAADVARALEYLHGQKVVHRDLKPGNIMLCADGMLKLIDLGLATSGNHPEAKSPLLSPAIGTPDYMPPEQVVGKAGDPRSDIYALGTILYEMVTGFVPFRGDNMLAVMNARVAGDPPAPTRLNNKLSPQVEEIILHAMERDPRNRYSSAVELREDLEDPDRVIPTGRVSHLRVPKPWMLLWLRMRDFAWAFLGILAFFALAILFVWKFGRHR
jgi:serine/threonine-protein kinase